MSWSQRFARHLKKSKLTQFAVAVALGVMPSQLSAWCRGATPREKTRQKIERWSDGQVPAEAGARSKAA